MRVLILGYGDVGKTAARILVSRGVETVVVEKADSVPEEGVEFVRGDVTLESFWEGFDVSGFDASIVALPDDLHAIFCTLMLKNQNPTMEVYVRCNNSENVEKMYAAGADYVINLPVVAAEIILSEIFGEEIRKKLMFENIEVRTYMVKKGSRLVNVRLSDLEKYGVKVIAVECDGETITDMDFKVKEGCKIAVAGKVDDLLRFEADLFANLL